MSEQEWMAIGYDKHIIDLKEVDEVPFYVAYKQWFCMKMTTVKSGTLDRIECAWNRYYAGDDISEKCISKISEEDIIAFLNGCFAKNPSITYKEYLRILQIINNVLVYMRDLKCGGAALYDWDRIKRYLPTEKISKNTKVEHALKDEDIARIIDNVVNYNIYPDKRSASLCLCMNFYLGLRIGELAALTFEDFDFERGVVRIYKTQSKFYNRLEDGSKIGSMVYRVVDSVKTVYSVREVPILPEVKAIYDKIKAHHETKKYDSPYLAYDGSDIVLYTSLERTLRNLCKLCNVPIINTHLIRKTFVTKLHFSGVPTRVISDLVGHSEIGTTENSYILNYSNNYDTMLGYMRGGLKYL
ncbi:MAG: site-specific integrase [Acetatifactor sp.]|nr:site-specific integrase [Acetatifactor sp.]